jgi:hypothetical protein
VQGAFPGGDGVFLKSGQPAPEEKGAGFFIKGGVMFWIKRLLGFSLVAWIFDKFVDREIKSVCEKVKKIQKPLERRILVIDDDRMMKSFIEKFMTGRFKVDQLYRIPDNLDDLRGYDAVVVDGRGIGNSRFEEGFDLCMAYDKPDGQSVVYYSGLGAYGRDRDALSERGVAVVTKGSDPEKLMLAIRFAMMKGEKS